MKIQQIPKLALTLWVVVHLSSCGQSSTQVKQINSQTPTPLKSEISTTASKTDCDCQLASEGKEFLEKRAKNTANSNPSIEELRQAVREKLLREQGEMIEVAQIENRTISESVSEIPVRIYTPEGEGNFPIILYYHGGGWATGDLDTHDNISRILAKQTNAIVVSVGYRLGPEHPFPAAIDDAYAALEWVAQQGTSFNGDPTRIALAGDSAGGNITAAIALKARDEGQSIVDYQVMFYPVMNLAEMNTESYQCFDQGYTLSKAIMELFRNAYTSNEQHWDNPYASPLLAENLQNLPPALMITASCDVLRDEAEQYAQRLKEAGVKVTLSRYPMVHGFVTKNVSLNTYAQQALNEAATALRTEFNTSKKAE